jgi:predicted lipoprotein with Yx(FWY)xxD motif
MSSFLRSAGLGLAATAGLVLAACGGTTASNNGGTASGSASSALIHTQSMKVGDKTMTVLKNVKGLTLYYFTPDTSTTIACTGTCASNWPPLMANGDSVSSGSSLPGQLTVVDGANGKQVAYNGHPLYTYSKDGDSGDAYGQGIGGKWFVATPDLAAAASPSASSSGYNPVY